MSFLEYFLQFLQLQTGERCSVSPLLTAGDVAVTLITEFIQFPLLLHPFHRRHPEVVAIVHGPAQLGVKRLSFHFSNPIVHWTQGGGGKELVKGGGFRFKTSHKAVSRGTRFCSAAYFYTRARKRNLYYSLQTE